MIDNLKSVESLLKSAMSRINAEIKLAEAGPIFKLPDRVEEKDFYFNWEITPEYAEFMLKELRERGLISPKL